MPESLLLQLDDAWPAGTLGLGELDARAWGPRLRYLCPARVAEDFWREIGPKLPKFILYGSGDFHHVAGIMLRRLQAPAILVSFDNHPDWDIRPPRWACGGWINRALELPTISRAVVWGCGNFELSFPARIWRNRAALASGQLQINGWAERQTSADAQRFECVSRDSWRDIFCNTLATFAGKQVYVTVDMDCLRTEEAATNWENGLFTADDIAWALSEIRRRAPIVAGDLCGAFSPPVYARPFQRFAGNWDHPKLPPRDPAVSRQINLASASTIWAELAK